MTNKEKISKYILPHMELYADGRLFNHKTNKFKKWSKGKNGYLQTSLYDLGKCKKVYQHRVLAIYFINNPKNKPEVNHINGIKNDNRLDNLEWVTNSENSKHAFNIGLKKVTRPYKKVIDTITNKIYRSVTEAANEHNISQSHLSNILAGREINKTSLKFY